MGWMFHVSVLAFGPTQRVFVLRVKKLFLCMIGRWITFAARGKEVVIASIICRPFPVDAIERNIPKSI
jgi:hypothetical protein